MKNDDKQISKRLEELELEYENVKKSLVEGQNFVQRCNLRLAELRGAYAELKQKEDKNG